MLLVLLGCSFGELDELSRAPDTGVLARRDDDDDGYGAGADCDDDDPARHPNADEVCGDGVDDDCDGMATECCPAPPTELTPLRTVRSDGAAERLLTPPLRAADVDGDGAIELLVGERWRANGDGGAWLLAADGEPETTLDAARATWTGAAEDELGAAAAVLARPEAGAVVLLGAPRAEGNSGQVCAYAGALTGALGAADATACWYGPEVSSGLGNDLDTPGDLDGDGRDDLLLVDEYTDGAGVAWLLAADAPGGDVADAAYAWLTAGLDEPQHGAARARGVGDVDGDGVPDLIVGWDALAAVSLAYGPLEGAWAAADLVPLPYTLPVVATTVGGPAGDLDGDGYAEIWTHAAHATLTPDAIAIWDGRAPPGRPDALLVGETRELLPSGAASPGDLDGDGADDLVLSATTPNPDPAPGQLYALRGPAVTGLVDLSCADTLAGMEGVDNLGTTLALAPDLDGDGLGELLVAAPSAVDGGSVYLFGGADFGW